MDQDVNTLQEGINLEFHSVWRQAFNMYINGSWTLAADMFKRCSSMSSNVEGDGPSECLLAYIESLDLTPPEDWDGSRKLETK